MRCAARWTGAINVRQVKDGTVWHAVIMAGGIGERLKPLTNRVPKPLLPLRGGGTLLSAAVDRALLLVPPERIWVVTTEQFRATMTRALPARLRPRVVTEPAVRGTATCIAVMAHLVAAQDAQAGLWIMPSDHWITPFSAFRAAIRRAMALCDERPNSVTCLGIRPTYPHTGYGYIHSAGARVTRFAEKPSQATAAAWIRRGHAWWNGGIFLGRTDAFARAFRQWAPDLWDHVTALPSSMGRELDTAMAALYRKLPARSFDRTVLEHYDDVGLVPATFRWNDVGSWAALPLMRRILAPRIARVLKAPARIVE